VVERLERQADYSSAAGAEFKNKWRNTSTVPHMPSWLGHGQLFSFSPFVIIIQHTNSAVIQVTNLTPGVFFRAGVCVRCGRRKGNCHFFVFPFFLRHCYFPRGMLNQSEISSCSGSCGSFVARCDMLGGCAHCST